MALLASTALLLVVTGLASIASEVQDPLADSRGGEHTLLSLAHQLESISPEALAEARADPESSHGQTIRSALRRNVGVLASGLGVSESLTIDRIANIIMDPGQVSPEAYVGYHRLERLMCTPTQNPGPIVPVAVPYIGDAVDRNSLLRQASDASLYISTLLAVHELPGSPGCRVRPYTIFHMLVLVLSVLMLINYKDTNPTGKALAMLSCVINTAFLLKQQALDMRHSWLEPLLDRAAEDFQASAQYVSVPLLYPLGDNKDVEAQDEY